MKTRILLRRFVAVAGATLLAHDAITAAEQPPVFSAPAPLPAAVVPAQPAVPIVSPAPTTTQVSANVAEVLKLVRAQVNDDVIVAFVGSSKSTYMLGANDIVYLRQQGVSDRVISAMLDHHVQAPAVPPVSAPAVQSSSAAPATTTTSYIAPAYVAAAPAYVYPAPTYAYYDYPYSRSCWGFPWPAISLGFGFGFGHHHGHGWGHRH